MRKKINLANIMSSLRIVLTPLLMRSLLAGESWLFFSFILFSFLAVTDFLDGFFARRSGKTSEFGSFIDPLADKFLIFGVFITFYFLELVPFWFIILLIARDALVTFLRVFIRKHGGSLKTSKIAKFKTVAQIILVYLFLIRLFIEYYVDIPLLFYGAVMSCLGGTYVVAGLTLYTGLDYLFVNREQLRKLLKGH